MTPASRRIVLAAALAAALALVALWAFVSHLDPRFSGERATQMLQCP